MVRFPSWCALALAVCAHSSPALAQSSDWTRVDQSATWYGVFAERAIGQRGALWFDGQWRRMGIGQTPQQLLLRPGLLATIAPGVQIGGGYAWIASSPYGESPAEHPTREHRLWQQLFLSHRAGALDVRHRYRWEQRWIAPLVDDETGAWEWQQRARYMVRAQRAIPALRLNGSPLLGFAWDELFVPVGGGGASLRLTQNRLGAGIGVPLDAQRRIEVGYMNLWNSLASRSTNELNHTLTLSLVVTPRPRAPAASNPSGK